MRKLNDWVNRFAEKVWRSYSDEVTLFCYLHGFVTFKPGPYYDLTCPLCKWNESKWDDFKNKHGASR